MDVLQVKNYIRSCLNNYFQECILNYFLALLEKQLNYRLKTKGWVLKKGTFEYTVAYIFKRSRNSK